jgi:Fic/DOC family
MSLMTVLPGRGLSVSHSTARDPGAKPAGYSALVDRYGLETIANWHESAISPGHVHRLETTGSRTQEEYPARRDPGDSLGDQLEFALKYDGVNLAILSKLFRVAPAEDVRRYVRSKPTGKYSRRAWYLYEFLTGRRLDLPDLGSTPYVDLLDQEAYFTSEGRLSRRHAIRDNLLGNVRFCPIVRRSEALRSHESLDFAQRCREVIGGYADGLLRRAVSHLYLKETRSSFEIEGVTPSASRAGRFVAALRQAATEDFLAGDALISLQNRIVDVRYRNTGYRQDQNFVGSTASPTHEVVHYVSPKPENLPDLMEGMIRSHRRLGEAEVHPVVHAAVIAFGFVFAHPFGDGNGRIHRFLIHNILARRGLTPEGMIFPVSATMLRERARYDRALEAFSRPLMDVLSYEFDERAHLMVEGETAQHYRYIDMTPQVEALFEFVKETIETDLVEELDFLRNHDDAKRGVQEIVDMPDRRLDLFIRLCLQNRGHLSKRKRESEFPELTDTEVDDMAAAMREGFRMEADG